MCDAQGHVKLADFGAARSCCKSRKYKDNSNTSSTSPVNTTAAEDAMEVYNSNGGGGTWQFMSPQCIRSEPYTAKVQYDDY